MWLLWLLIIIGVVALLFATLPGARRSGPPVIRYTPAPRPRRRRRPDPRLLLAGAGLGSAALAWELRRRTEAGADLGIDSPDDEACDRDWSADDHNRRFDQDSGSASGLDSNDDLPTGDSSFDPGGGDFGGGGSSGEW